MRRALDRKGRGRPRKALPWVGYELDSQENIDRFIQDTIKATWKGTLGTRQASAINGAIRLLRESRDTIQKPQQKTSTDNERVSVADFVRSLPRDLREEVAKYVKQQAGLEENA